MKKILSIVFILFVTFGLNATVTDRAILVTFTATDTCFVGFSKKNVTNCVQVTKDEEYASGSVVSFKFDSVNNYYYTEPVYAYCQAFSSTGLKVTISAPAVMKNAVTNETITYTLPNPANATETTPFSNWSTVLDAETGAVVSYYASFADRALAVDEYFSQPRVLMSQPIQLQVKNTKLPSDQKYVVEFTITVEASS